MPGREITLLMFNKMNDADNIEKIIIFLNENNLIFKQTERFTFNVYDQLNNLILQIRYVNSAENKIGYKKFGYDGLSAKYCFEISKSNEDNRIRVMWWRDFEIENPRKNEVIKSYILAVCGKIKNRIYARDCVIKEIPSKQLRSFLDTNCFYGYRSASKNFGLYLKKDKGQLKKDDLAMMWSIGHPFYGKSKYDLEIIRASTVLFTQVVGGSSKLFSHIKNIPVFQCGKKEIKWNSLAFYCDYDHNNGASLPLLGFKLLNYSGGGFMNINTETGEAFNRKPAMHKQIMQMMAEGKVISTPLAGVKTFIFCRDGDYSKYGI